MADLGSSMALMMDNPLWMQRRDILLGMGVIAVVGMLVIPLPTFLLDFLMAFSILVGMLTLLIVMFIPRAHDFAIFPSLLLISTVFRLALNVSSTRLILLEGAAFDGKIVRTFGDFVVGGNYVVGFIIFIILIAVQFLVITKGATRTAEVAARFTLDSLPGKQLSIDTDFSNGIITEEEARRRRTDLQRESNFYGAMDGASKFVQGDVKVGILITIINLIGGFIIGMVMRGESFDVALKTYSLLTIGDGLVGQIPSLLMTTATGIIVTRSVSEDALPDEIAKQMTTQPRALYIAAGALLLSAFIPGFPKISIILLAGGLGGMAYLVDRSKKEEEEKKVETERTTAARDKKPETVIPQVNIDTLEVEIGYGLIPLVDPNQGGILLDRVTNIRRQTALNMGLIVPPVRIRDNIHLEPNMYAILVRGVEVGSSLLQVGKMMAMDAGNVIEKIPGEEFVEPVFNQNAIWIEVDQRDVAERNGYVVVDCPTMIATHLTELIRKHAHEILGRQETQQLIDTIKKDYPVVVDELLGKNQIGLGIIQKVLQNLLREGVSIRNMVTILETMANYAGYTTHPDVLTEYVRSALSRQLCRDYADANNTINAILVDPEIEGVIRASIHDDPVEGRVVGMDPQTHEQVMKALQTAYIKAKKLGHSPLFLVSPHIRSVLFALMERDFGSVVVLSYNEIVPSVRVAEIATAVAA